MVGVLQGLRQKRLDPLAVIEAEEKIVTVLRASSVFRSEAEAYGREVAELRAAADALTTVILDLERIAVLDRSTLG